MSRATTTARSSTATTTVLVASAGFLAGTMIGPKLLEWYRSYQGRDTSRGSSCIYLDYNGTTPIYPEVLEAMMPYLTCHYGNPSSPHAFAVAPRAAIDAARSQILRCLLEAPDDTPLSSIVFTSCGTESDNLAIHIALLNASERKQERRGGAPSSPEVPHIVSSNIEHPAIEACLRSLERQGRCAVTFVPVQTDGIIKISEVKRAMTSSTVLVTVMTANNEVGSVQPIAEIAGLCRAAGVLFHTDAAQAAGKIPVTLQTLGDPDLVSLVGHKLGAPKGVACLYVRPGSLANGAESASALLIGGGQEGGRRAGTENTPYIVGMGAAAEHASRGLTRNAARLRSMRSLLLQKLRDELGADLVRPNGPDEDSLRLPNTLSVGLRGVHSGRLIQAIGDRVAASAGATCHSTEDAPVSGVLQAMGVPLEYARGTLRLSLGPNTLARDVTLAASIIAKEARKQLHIGES
jgi:cysteine desulfurase